MVGRKSSQYIVIYFKKLCIFNVGLEWRAKVKAIKKSTWYRDAKQKTYERAGVKKTGKGSEISQQDGHVHCAYNNR